MQWNGAPGIVTGPFRLGAESIPSIQQFYANSVMEQISEGAAYPLCQPTQKNLPGCLCFVSKWQVRSVAGNYKSLTSHYICELFALVILVTIDPVLKYILTSILCNTWPPNSFQSCKGIHMTMGVLLFSIAKMSLHSDGTGWNEQSNKSNLIQKLSKNYDWQFLLLFKWLVLIRVVC